MPPPTRIAASLLPASSCECTCADPTTFPSPLDLLASDSQFSTVRSQWENPNDILSLLMIIGGDVVQRAVAQLSGHTSYFVPTAFSFGWVGYSMNAVLLSIGEGRLMPPADCSSILVNAKNGYIKANQSWILGRIVRDHRTPTPHKGLTVTFFRTSPIAKHTMPGVPHRDWLYWSGVVCILIQLGISIIPGAIHNDWVTLVVTAAGTMLALLGGAQPQWATEKWACRRLKPGGREVVCLTRGNGNKDVIVIVNEGGDKLRLEDLANLRDSRARYTIVYTSILAVLWFVLLLTVAGLQNNAWYVLAVGSLGMIQNYIVAGVRRSPGAFGIHLEGRREVHKEKVFDALVAADDMERGVGVSLIPVFFPGGLFPHEEKWVKERRELIAAHEDRRDKKVQAQASAVSIVAQVD
ncbi:hypothetical protein BXZ70DRAFT_978755 [Cristinia sonorae]|uniref:Uncharacterized protein n=1 Tax=Cristinia sonorae TaxID=1940300 RepID=A0A8K0UF95_9AGAR|nr:hypothetical protein BXZ70DRAFT_978755 [Cristinia sonorae]